MKQYMRCYLLLFISLLWISCNNTGYKTSEQGLQYRMIREKSGPKIRQGNIVQLNLAYFTMADSLLYDSKVIGDSFIIKVASPVFKGGFEDALMLMGEGDSAEFLLPSDSVFQRMFHKPMPPALEQGSLMKFRVGVNKVLTETEYAEKIRKEYARQQKLQLEAIEQYLAANNFKIKPVAPGIYFVVMQEGKGRIPAYGDSVEVRYTGKTLEGKVFDSSSKAGENLRYRIGKGGLIDAWERAVTSMKTGSMARLILTSDQAFGKASNGPVPPDTPVIFDIELIRIY